MLLLCVLKSDEHSIFSLWFHDKQASFEAKIVLWIRSYGYESTDIDRETKMWVKTNGRGLNMSTSSWGGRGKATIGEICNGEKIPWRHTRWNVSIVLSFRRDHYKDGKTLPKNCHCAKSQIFGPEFARIRIGARRVYRNVLTYSIAADSKHTWNILSESGLFFRIQI